MVEKMTEELPVRCRHNAHEFKSLGKQNVQNSAGTRHVKMEIYECSGCGLPAGVYCGETYSILKDRGGWFIQSLGFRR